MSTHTATGWGIEVEIENNPTVYRKKNSRVVAEGSLRNSGREYVSTILTQPQDAKHWHKLLVGGLSRMGCDFSERCGVHIHMDFRGKNTNKIKDFLRNYTVVERHLFKLIDLFRERSTSNFSMPLLDSPGSLIKVLRGASSVESLALNWKKYSAINLGRLHDLGSIEFRGLPTIADVTLFNQVVDILNNARTLTFQEMAELYNIPAKDLAEVRSFWAIIDKPTASSHKEIKVDVMLKVFGYEKPEQNPSELTEAVILETIRELGL